MHCPYCGVETKVSSARFCSACRTAFWDLTSTGECPPVPAPEVRAIRDTGPRIRNRIFLAAEILSIMGLTAALYVPAIQGTSIRAEDYLNLHLGLVLLCSLIAWANSKWSVIVSVGVGFAVTLTLSLGESGLRWHDQRPDELVSRPYQGPVASTLVHRSAPVTQNAAPVNRTRPTEHS